MTRMQSLCLTFSHNIKDSVAFSFSLFLFLILSLRFVKFSAGGGESDPVFKWEASFIQEASRALGARSGEGKCQDRSEVYKDLKT